MDIYIIILVILLLITGLAAFTFWHSLREERKIISQYKLSLSSLVEEAQRKSEEIINSANVKSASIVGAANQYNEEIKKYNAEFLERLNNKEKDTNESLKNLLAKVEDAKRALDGLNALEIAARNRVNGWGDEYILPTHLLLDELGDHVGWNEAGQRLKSAREASRDKVRAKTAIICKWGDAAYQKDAIRLMHEAFDSQVDLALNKIKGDENVGKVIQEITDLFISMNDYGTRCMRAEITKPYLNSRLSEAKWGAVAYELRNKEREEQRAKQAELREEAQLERDLEKAKREAEREEQLTRRAMLKAEQEALNKEKEMQREYEKKLRQVELDMKEAVAKDEDERAAKEAELKAQLEKLLLDKDNQSAELRAKFESEKAELELRLKDAEGNQRSLSMAQQTKRGHVYIISNIGSFGQSVLKVGMTRRLDPMDRIWELGDASVPFDFDVHALIQSDNAPELESKLHNIMDELRINKINTRKEFFKLTISEVRKLVEDLGVNAEWTMASKALEYRETLALEESFRNNPEAKKRWLSGTQETV